MFSGTCKEIEGDEDVQRILKKEPAKKVEKVCFYNRHKKPMYTVGKRNPGSHSTMRVRIPLSHCVRSLSFYVFKCEYCLKISAI